MIAGVRVVLRKDVSDLQGNTVIAGTLPGPTA
jgi:hypothetical protein